MKQKVLKLMCLLCVCMMGASAWGTNESLTIDFENQVGTYTKWSLDNFAQSGSGITAHDGSNFGTTGGKTTASATTKDKIASPQSFSCYFSKTSNNTTASTWYLEVSTDGSNWTEVATQDAKSMNKGVWVEFTADLTKYSDVYVRLRYDGTTAVRAVDDIVLTYSIGDATPTCSAPTFSVADGMVFAGTEVTISSATDGATIYYTTDGSTPSASSSVYSAAITINESMTIKAYAVKSGYDDSDVATASYTIKPTVSGYTVDFESDLEAYVDWTFTSVNTDNTAISAHDGSKYAATAGTTTASIATKAAIANPTTFTCYVSKVSKNTTSSNWYVEVSTDGSDWTEVTTQDATSMSQGDWTEIEADLSSYSNVYVRLRYNGSTAIRTVDDINIEVGGKKSASVTIGATTLDLDASTTVTTTGPTVTLTTSDASVVSVSGTTVTAVSEGTATITATWDENEDFKAGNKVFTVTVKDLEKGLTEAKALTVAEAKAVIDESYSSSASTEDYYVKGIISKIDSYNSTHASITYWISDDGTTTNQFEVYGGLSFDGISFTGKENLQVGATVVVKGKITYYSKNSVYEFSQNSNLVSLQYTRVTSANNWGTICLPYNATVTGAKLYLLAGKELDGGEVKSLVFEEETEIEAGIPYAFKATGSELVATYKTTTEYADADDWNGMYGTYSAIAGGSYGSVTNLYLMTADKVQKANPANSTLAANRAYINMDEVDEYTGGASVKAIRMYFDGTVEDATGINGLTPALNEGNAAVYNVNGQRMETLQKGINIVGGKKVIIK